MGGPGLGSQYHKQNKAEPWSPVTFLLLTGPMVSAPLGRREAGISQESSRVVGKGQGASSVRVSTLLAGACVQTVDVIKPEPKYRLDSEQEGS